jgi:microcystin-dependent protein
MKYLLSLSILLGFSLARATADFTISLISRNPGDVITTALPSCPSGTLEANGAEVAKASYNNLFLAIGSTYGAPTSTTFKLPDYRGRFLRSSDEAGIRAPGGSLAVGTVQNQATAKNGLTLNDPGHNHIEGFAGVNSAASFGTTTTNNGNQNSQDGINGANHPYTSTSGSNVSLSAGDTETRPMNISVKHCVAY